MNAEAEIREPGARRAGAPLGTIALLRLLLWAQGRTLLARIRGIRQQSPLLLFVLAAFIAGYLVIGYWLFHVGLNYLYHAPLIGALLSQRILYLIFGFFFVMLVFSNLIIGYSTLFRNSETSWLLTLPISHRNVYRWKFLESIAVSSWALIFLSAPMMAAYGHVHGASPSFYFQIVFAYIPFVIIPGLFGSWIILLLVRVLARVRVGKALTALAAVVLLVLIFGIKPISETQAVREQEVLSFDQLLRHTRLSLNPFLPSAWLAQSVLAWTEGLGRQGGFYFLVALSNALLGMLIGFGVVDRAYYGSWSASLSSRAERAQRKAAVNRRRPRGRSALQTVLDATPFFSRSTMALVGKDVRVFWRDPAQWTQFMIFFGLLCIYVINLRNVAFDFANIFWETMISYLNLAASALTLSTLTTRFVFPQFSLEGRRLWIIGLAPVGLRRVLLQKFWLSSVVSMAITVSLMIASSAMLHLGAKKIVLFGGAIGVMSMTLCGLAVGLGALFPNLKEDNPSKIVSGFGGTLCLVISFLYIATFVGLAAVPALRKVMLMTNALSDGAALTLAVLLSALVLFLPLSAAMVRVKNLEF